MFTLSVICFPGLYRQPRISGTYLIEPYCLRVEPPRYRNSSPWWFYIFFKKVLSGIPLLTLYQFLGLCTRVISSCLRQLVIVHVIVSHTFLIRYWNALPMWYNKKDLTSWYAFFLISSVSTLATLDICVFISRSYSFNQANMSNTSNRLNPIRLMNVEKSLGVVFPLWTYIIPLYWSCISFVPLLSLRVPCLRPS